MAVLKNTKQRGAIMEILRNSADPVSAEEIFDSLKNEYPNLALSTIYRNLERFSENGMVTRDVFNDGVVRYSIAEEHHGHYLVCTQCSNKIKIDDCPLMRLEQGLQRDTGYEIEGHTLTIYGKCPDCLRREQGAREPHEKQGE
ncbi:Fur family transcriptional regulator [Caproiciproducens sp. LBM24188]|nr:transcriptional repressor [Oscillospiraceae bacterium]HHV31556.1 transcriptional repressor [Clostridiales bacterium]